MPSPELPINPQGSKYDHQITVSTALGFVALAATHRGLRSVTLPKPTPIDAIEALKLASEFDGPQAFPLDHLSASMIAYFSGEPIDFSEVPLDLSGLTDFQGCALLEVQRIPRGQTMTYGEVAARIGNPKASRAVGAMMAANPVCIVVPCHRVIGAGGALIGFGGGLPLKRHMLVLEGARYSLPPPRT